MGFHAYCTGKVASKPNYLILTTKLYPKRWPLDIALAADMENPLGVGLQLACIAR